jgi:hypothetical protein
VSLLRLSLGQTVSAIRRLHRRNLASRKPFCCISWSPTDLLECALSHFAPQGGGVRASGGSLVLRSNTFLDNTASSGSALYIAAAVTSSDVFNNTFLVGFTGYQASMIDVQNSDRWACAFGTYMLAPPFSMRRQDINFTGCRYSCPSGTFGSTTNLTGPECSGNCPRGYYCPAETKQPIPCPIGTHLPTHANTSDGTVVNVIGYGFSSCLPCAHGVASNPGVSHSPSTYSLSFALRTFTQMHSRNVQPKRGASSGRLCCMPRR